MKKKLIIYYKNNTLDLTDFISNHPGGDIILKANDKNIEKFWYENNLEFHLNSTSVLNILNKYIITNNNTDNNDLNF